MCSLRVPPLEWGANLTPPAPAVREVAQENSEFATLEQGILCGKQRSDALILINPALRGGFEAQMNPSLLTTFMESIV
jgi:hypothetical protein